MAIPPRPRGANEGDLVRLVLVDDHVFMRDLVARTLTRQRGRYRSGSNLMLSQTPTGRLGFGH
jgi:hypothetical protein